MKYAAGGALALAMGVASALAYRTLSEPAALERAVAREAILIDWPPAPAAPDMVNQPAVTALPLPADWDIPPRDQLVQGEQSTGQSHEAGALAQQEPTSKVISGETPDDAVFPRAKQLRQPPESAAPSSPGLRSTVGAASDTPGMTKAANRPGAESGLDLPSASPAPAGRTDRPPTTLAPAPTLTTRPSDRPVGTFGVPAVALTRSEPQSPAEAGRNLPAEPAVGTNRRNLPSEPPVGTNPAEPAVGTNPAEPAVGTSRRNLPSEPPVGTNPSEPAVGTNGRNLPAEPPVGTNPRNLPAEPVVGTSRRNLPAEPPVGTNRRNLPSEPPVGTPDPRESVRAVLDRYRSAYRRLDAAAARTVWPAVDASALARAFGALASQDLWFEACAITVSGGSADAICRGQARVVPKIGGGSETANRTWQFKLRQAGSDWLIEKATVK